MGTAAQGQPGPSDRQSLASSSARAASRASGATSIGPEPKETQAAESLQSRQDPATQVPLARILEPLRSYWGYDTLRAFATVNGIEAHGGSIDVAGVQAAGSMIYVQSGYSMFGELPGNVLLAFRLCEGDCADYPGGTAL